MKLLLRKTKIQKLDFILSSCPDKEKEDMLITYQFIRELFCKVCRRCLIFSDNKYNFVDYPFLFSERQLDSVVLPVISEMCKGMVIAEYPVVRNKNLEDYEKENSKGRIDYWCIYKDYSFVIEMKHGYDAFRTGTTKDSLVRKWNTMNKFQLQDIRKYVKRFGESTSGLIRLGLHFITPYCDREMNMDYIDEFERRQKEILERLYKDVNNPKRKTTTPDFMGSWRLPRIEKYYQVPEPNNGTYPGLMLLGKIFGAIKHDGCIEK